MPHPPAIVIHGLDHARLALASGVAVTLLSAPGAALYAGAGWWRALIAQSGTRLPDIVDCADAPGRALEALACCCRIIVLHPCPAWDQVAARASDAGATLLRERPPALDLAVPGAARDIAAWLAIG